MKAAYNKILANREADLTANIHGHFSKEQLSEIYEKAKNKFDELIKKRSPTDEESLNKIWHEIISDFHSSNYWGYKKLTNIPNEKVKKELSLNFFIPAFIIPIIITKTAILYFGINWSNYPGEGYGYGFFATLLFAVLNFTFFLWRHRHYSED